MSGLISGKEALIAWYDGKDVEIKHKDTGWYSFNDHNFGITVFKSKDHDFRLKPRTITLNGIEIPAPFEPKLGERYWRPSFGNFFGYDDFIMDDTRVRSIELMLGAWRTEEEIKQVVEALRSVFK